jgi:hypothetical protein
MVLFSRFELVTDSPMFLLKKMGLKKSMSEKQNNKINESKTLKFFFLLLIVDTNITDIHTKKK